MTGEWQLGEEGVLRWTAWEKELPWLSHGFGTRLATNWPLAKNHAYPRQIHSSRVIRASELGALGEADGVLSNEPGLFVSVRTADCLPILIADPERRAVAAVHAGWRGTLEEIAARAVRGMEAEFGSQASNLQALIGPGIGRCCFETGPEVAERFQSYFPERTDLNRRTFVDLAKANQTQLERAGIGVGRIHVSPECTRCNGAWFHSYRRDGQQAGRMTAAVAVLN